MKQVDVELEEYPLKTAAVFKSTHETLEVIFSTNIVL